MSLFKSKFAKLESFSGAAVDTRTPEMLQLAQAEMDSANAGIVLVPKNEKFKTLAELDTYVESLEADATDAKAAAKTAQDALTELKGQRVLGSDKVASDKKEGGDTNAPKQSKEALEAIEAAHEKPYTERVMKMLAEKD